jgi:PQ loop repeat
MLYRHVREASFNFFGSETDSTPYSLLLFLIFFPRATASTPSPTKDPEGPSIRTALIVTVICLVHGIITFILSLYFILVYPNSLQSWADFLGIFSTMLASIQYLPQIYTTFMLKRVGSLSIPMMCIQTPGSFVWAASLAARLGTEGWSAWGVYLVTGCLQGSLLVMGVYFELTERRRRKAEELDASDQPSDSINGALQGNGRPSEHTPLLQSDE